MLEQQITKILDQNNFLLTKVAELHTLPQTVERISKDMSDIKDSISDIKQSIAVHSSKLVTQEKDAENLKVMLEKRRDAAEEDTKALNSKIDTIEEDLRKEIYSSQQDIIDAIDDMKKEQKTHHETVEKRIGRIEKWMWLAMGIASFVIWLMENYAIPLITKGG